MSWSLSFHCTQLPKMPCTGPYVPLPLSRLITGIAHFKQLRFSPSARCSFGASVAKPASRVAGALGPTGHRPWASPPALCALVSSSAQETAGQSWRLMSSGPCLVNTGPSPRGRVQPQTLTDKDQLPTPCHYLAPSPLRRKLALHCPREAGERRVFPVGRRIRLSVCSEP